MGYRSQVCIGMNDNVFEALAAYVELSGNEDLKELFKHADVNEYKDANKMFWDSIKWYEGYPDIDLFNNFLSQLNDNTGEFGMVIVGESDDDVQREGIPCEYDIYVERHISW
jgi:hypothetical protein